MPSINVGKYKITVEDPLVRKLSAVVDSDGVSVIATESGNAPSNWYLMQVTTEGRVRVFAACPYSYLVEVIDV